MELCNLPRDLVEEIASKLPDESLRFSLRAMRLTCKNWSKSFGEKHIISEETGSRESMVMKLINHKVYLMDINLHDSSIKRKAKLISLNGLDDQVDDISQIFQCDGLLLCVTKDENKNKKLVIWNPYSAETRWIESRDYHHYAIEYQKKKKNGFCRIHKILRFYEDGYKNFRCEIYVSKTNSWRFSRLKWYLSQCSMSLKGNTYWIASHKSEDLLFLVCFDFTRETFGPRLSLPFKFCSGDTLGLSSVREEQLVVVIQKWFTCVMEIWVTSNIEPKTVSWNKLFDTRPLAARHFQFGPFSTKSVGFFIDEEKKIVVVMDSNEDKTRHIAYIIGENGYAKEVDLGEVTDKYFRSSCNYVHIKKPRSKQIIF